MEAFFSVMDIKKQGSGRVNRKHASLPQRGKVRSVSGFALLSILSRNLARSAFHRAFLITQPDPILLFGGLFYFLCFFNEKK
jgi:hypothetical protein